MAEYQEKLRELTQDEVVSQLDGAEGLLALTRSELFYIGPSGVQRAQLSQIKKVVGGKGGMLQIVGESGPLIEAPVSAFQVGELKAFFESVKTFVARRKMHPAESLTQPEMAPEPDLAAQQAAAESGYEATTNDLFAEKGEAGAAVDTNEPVTLDEEPETRAPITPPEEPLAAADVYASDEVLPPEEPSPAAKKGGGVTGLLLKLTSLATIGYAGYWIYSNQSADVMTLVEVALVGLGAALVEWHVSNL